MFLTVGIQVIWVSRSDAGRGITCIQAGQSVNTSSWSQDFVSRQPW